MSGVETVRGHIRMAALVVMDEVGETDKALAAAIAVKATRNLLAANLLAQPTADEAEGDEWAGCECIHDCDVVYGSDL